MTLSVPPMLPEDRKHLDIPLMPAPRTRFQKDGLVWELVDVQAESCPTRKQRLKLDFIAVASVNPVNPV